MIKLDYYLPKNIVSNSNLLSEFPDLDVSKIEKKIGIKQRHIVEKETALDLAYGACIKVLTDYDKSKIDFLILCTQSPDYYLPTSACILQDRLKLSKNVGAFDFNLGCSGYIYGLAIAKGLISSGVAKNVLLATAETYSKHIHPKDKANRAIFGDGATATIISAVNGNIGLGEFELGTDGSGFDKLIVKNGGFRMPVQADQKEYEYGSGNITSDNHLYMDGPEIFNFTIETVPDLVNRTLVKNNLNLEDIDYFIFHQANSFMLNFLRKKLKISQDKFYNDLSETGNTVSSTIPIALKKAIKKGLIKEGDKVMLVGFGVGLSWGASIVDI